MVEMTLPVRGEWLLNVCRCVQAVELQEQVAGIGNMAVYDRHVQQPIQ